MFWYQGEADNNDAAGHVAGFTALLTDWRREVGFRVDGGPGYYVVQARQLTVWKHRRRPAAEAQRRMADTLKVTVLHNGPVGREGCHFAWERGYRELGDQAFAVAARDIHRGPGEGVAAPNPRSAAFTDARRTEVIVLLRNPDPLTVQAGAGTDFTIDGSTATVTGVEYREGGGPRRACPARPMRNPAELPGRCRALVCERHRGRSAGLPGASDSRRVVVRPSNRPVGRRGRSAWLALRGFS